MKLTVPLYTQQYSYTCGPVCLHMILHYWGIRATRRELIEAVGATEKAGTSNTRMIKGARAYGMRVHAHSHATLQEVEEWLAHGVPVIINYIEPKYREGHYAVVVGATPTAWILHDPWQGTTTRLAKSYLQKNWRGGFTTTHRWMMAAVPRDKNIYTYGKHKKQ